MTATTASTIVCPSWCDDCDRSKDRDDLPPDQRAVTHSSRNVEGLTRDTSFWFSGLAGGDWHLRVTRTDYYDGRVDLPNIWLNGYVHTPAEARMLGRALEHIADLAEQ